MTATHTPRLVPAGPRERLSLIQASDTTIRVRDLGERDHPAVVVLHGITGHSYEWDDMVALLAERQRVIVPDQRGHGRSGHAGNYRVTDMVHDLVSVLDHLEVDSVHLVGHSLGGMVAMQAAAAHPGRVAGLVVIDIGPNSFDTAFAAALPEMLRMLGAATYPSIDHAVREWMSMNPAALEEPTRRFVEHGLLRGPDGCWRWAFDGPGLSRSALSLTSADELWQTVDQVTAPTLLIRGAASPLLDRATAIEMTDRFAHASLIEVEGGHDLAVECPTEVGRLVGSFLAASAAQ